MAKSLLDMLFDKISQSLGIGTPEWIGAKGEKLTEKELKWLKLFGDNGYILKNIYVPKDNGETSEIDVIYITQKGIFVIESKNYSGWIFGSEDSYYWTAMLPNKQKNKFYNPILQNKTHIKWLLEYLTGDIPMFSLIVFSERCEIKKRPEIRTELRVIKRDRLIGNIRDIWDNVPDKLTSEEVREIYDKLKLLTYADEETKQAHIEQIKNKYEKHNSDTENKTENLKAKNEPVQEKEIFDKLKEEQTEKITDETTAATDNISSNENQDTVAKNNNSVEEKICPKCGNKMILRTAKKGANSGNRFYGCSAFPKCRYIENTGE